MIEKIKKENIKKILGDSNDIIVKEVFTWNEKIKTNNTEQKKPEENLF